MNCCNCASPLVHKKSLLIVKESELSVDSKILINNPSVADDSDELEDEIESDVAMISNDEIAEAETAEIVCKICGKVCGSKAGLGAHMRTHRSEI